MLLNVKWLGHATLMFTAGKIIYIDPYQLKGNPQKANMILITHDHYDHFSETDIAKIQTDDTLIIMPASTKKTIPGNICTIKTGDILRFDDITVEAVPAYNTDKNFHPKSARNVGYILTINNVRYYHAGDTDIIPEMENLNVDVAFLPVGGTYTMTSAEAAEAARLIKPKVAVPIHFNSIVGSMNDALTFEKLCDCPVTILPQEK